MRTHNYRITATTGMEFYAFVCCIENFCSIRKRPSRLHPVSAEPNVTANRITPKIERRRSAPASNALMHKNQHGRHTHTHQSHTPSDRLAGRRRRLICAHTKAALWSAAQPALRHAHTNHDNRINTQHINGSSQNFVNRFRFTFARI